jgi:hypothetical protein
MGSPSTPQGLWLSSFFIVLFLMLSFQALGLIVYAKVRKHDVAVITANNRGTTVPGLRNRVIESNWIEFNSKREFQAADTLGIENAIRLTDEIHNAGDKWKEAQARVKSRTRFYVYEPTKTEKRNNEVMEALPVGPNKRKRHVEDTNGPDPKKVRRSTRSKKVPANRRENDSIPIERDPTLNLPAPNNTISIIERDGGTIQRRQVTTDGRSLRISAPQPVVPESTKSRKGKGKSKLVGVVVDSRQRSKFIEPDSGRKEKGKGKSKQASVGLDSTRSAPDYSSSHPVEEEVLMGPSSVDLVATDVPMASPDDMEMASRLRSLSIDIPEPSLVQPRTRAAARQRIDSPIPEEIEDSWSPELARAQHESRAALMAPFSDARFDTVGKSLLYVSPLNRLLLTD